MGLHHGPLVRCIRPRRPVVLPQLHVGGVGMKPRNPLPSGEPSKDMIKRIAAALAALTLLAPASVDANPACNEKKARRQIKTFIAAYNNGDLETLERIFAPGSRFQEYRVGPLERPAPFSEDRASLIDYFAERHSYNDRFELQDLKVGPDPNTDGFYTHVTVKRTSDDPAPWGEGYFEPGKSGVNSRCEISLFRIERTGP